MFSKKTEVNNMLDEDSVQLTEHSKKRMRQRGFSELALNIIQNYGRCESAPGDATKVFLGNKECQEAVREFKRAIQELDKARGGAIIISGNKILTVYHSD